MFFSSVEHILGICLMMDPGQQGSDIALTLPPSSLIPLKVGFLIVVPFVLCFYYDYQLSEAGRKFVEKF